MKSFLTGNRFARFVAVGLTATAAHYVCLNILVFVRPDTLVWKLNILAAAVGITTSYLGNRYFVFASVKAPFPELLRFVSSYVLLGLVHTAMMYIMVDSVGLPLSIGFVIATSIQIVLSYTANRLYVFYSA